MKIYKIAYSDWDVLTIGPTPVNENCAQVGTDIYDELNKIEIQTFAEQIERMFPNKPKNVIYKRQGSDHEFGTYHELGLKYLTTDDDAINWVFNVENNTPMNWDSISKSKLKSLGYFDKL